MAMYSRVPVIPLIKDYNVLTIKTKTFRVALTGGRFESFDQDMINGSSVEALLIGVSQFRDMANTCAFSPADTFSYFKRCLTDIALSDWLNVEVHPEDQSYDSFEEAMALWLDDRLPNESFQHQRQWMLRYLSKPFSMLVMDYGARIKTLNRLLQLMPHPEDQVGLSKEDIRIIIIRSMPDEWQQEFELNHAKTSDQSIRSVLAYFESQQSFKDRNKHLPKNSFQTITQNMHI